MRTLKFIVNGAILQPDPSCDFSNLVPGSVNELRAEFSFSSDWNGYKKVAAFRSALGRPFPAMMLSDGKSCMIPAEAVAGRVFKIHVVGKKGNTKIRTSTVEVKQYGGEA